MTEELIRIDSFFKNLEDKTIVRNSNDLSINKQYASVLIFPDTRQIEVPNLPSTTNDKKRKNNEEPPQKEDITFFTCYIVNSSEREDDKNDKVVRQVESSFLKFYRYIYDDTNIICLPYEYSILEVEIIIKIFILKYSVNTCTISQNYNILNGIYHNFFLIMNQTL